MNIRLTLRILGGLLIFLSATLLLPIAGAFHAPGPGRRFDGGLYPLLFSALVTAAAGFALYRGLRARGEITHREGFGIVTFGWLAFAAFGSLPFLFSHVIPNPISAFFEAMSGFTTTGATVITNLDDVPRSILLWRSMTQWLGGMGIIVLSLAILPFLGVSGMQLFEAEVPGPTADRLSPRIQDTAKVLWGVYLTLTITLVLLLWAGEMSLFESICHAFTTMATGGFSTRNTSIAAFEGHYTHLIITLFMFLAGINFTLHYHLLRGKIGRLWANEEFRWYLGLALGASFVVALLNAPHGDSFGITLRDAAFQCISIMTTTGFVTADYELWSVTTQYILVILMFIGGCAGSTGGGIKVIRIMLATKQSFLQVSKLLHPREIRVLKRDDIPVPREIILSISTFMCVYVGVFLLGSLLMTANGLDLVTAGATVMTCLNNVGPGLGTVGPTETFAHIPLPGQIILSICMLVGRLELFTVLVLFSPSCWRK